MRSVIGREAFWILAFAGIAAAAFGTFYLFAEKAAHPNSLVGRYMKQDRAGADQSKIDPRTGVVVMYRDREIKRGEKRWIFRGFEEGRIRIDVIVPALDPDAVYPYHIAPDQGGQSFQFSGRRFRLLSARNDRLRIRELPASP
jgi:hypothetical protein